MRTIVCLNLLLVAACNSASKPDFETSARKTELSIAALKALCDGRSNVTVTRDVAIHGQVVANDLYGEFSRSIVIQDDSGGISIAIEGSRLARKFPFGAWVEVRCNGLTLRDYGGKILLGTLPDENGYSEIPEEEIERYIRIPEDGGTPPQAARITFEEVRSDRIDTRVRFDGVHFAEAGAMWCDTDPKTGECISTEREIIDEKGNRFPVRTLWCCDYAKEALPAGTGTLIGVIDYCAGKFSLRVTFREIDFPEGAGISDRDEGNTVRRTAESPVRKQKVPKAWPPEPMMLSRKGRLPL